MSHITTLVTERMLSKFEDHMPESLYMSHYDLASALGGTPTAWREFLRQPDIQRHIEAEIGFIAEANARKALSSLNDVEQASSSQVQAWKEILNKSKLLQQKNQSHEKIIITYIPAKEY